MNMRKLNFAVALLLIGCDSTTGVCTQRGCTGGLLVRLNPASPAAYRLEVWSEESPPQVFECTAGYCGDVFFPDFEGEHVTVRIVPQTGAVREERFLVMPEPVYPNGRRCGIGCYRATIAVDS
jgi:hypothetical protein